MTRMSFEIDHGVYADPARAAFNRALATGVDDATAIDINGESEEDRKRVHDAVHAGIVAEQYANKSSYAEAAHSFFARHPDVRRAWLSVPTPVRA